MSGIAGIYRLDGSPVERARLVRMTDRLSHRGPDGAGHWTDGCVGLGHRMLHATPESVGECQPLVDERAALCAVVDGRVDNREELRASLNTVGARLRDDTDAELILRAYECWGEACPARILGDFAFAIWDGRRRQLFCARDPLGIKPFYYWRDAGRFVFASEIESLFEVPPLRARPNLPLIGLYISYRFSEQEETLYEGILRLPAAHALVVRDDTFRTFRYWDIDPESSVRYRTDDDYAEHFLSVFQEAVRVRLRSHRPVCATLSGGLDSSSVVCTAQSLYARRLVPGNRFETFSIVFDTLPCDERQYINEVVRHSEVTATYLTYESQLPWMTLYPTRSPDIVFQAPFFIEGAALGEAGRRGFRVKLDGVGGDELLACGFDHLTDLARAGRWRELQGQLRHDAEIYSVSPRALFFDYCVRPFVPAAVKRVVRPLLQPWRGNGTSHLLRPEFVRATSLEERLGRTITVPKFPTRAQQRIYVGLFLGWNATIALGVSDLFHAGSSVEPRHPFLDRRLVEFAMAIPEDQRWRGDQPKTVLRHAMVGLLPNAVRWRKRKGEFAALIDYELRQRHLQTVEQLFRGSTLAALGIVDHDRLLQLWEGYRRGTSEHLAGFISLLVALELWGSAMADSRERCGWGAELCS